MRDWWVEELLLVQHEMDWTCNSFHHKAEEWICLTAISKLAQKEEHLAYAERQCKIYWCLFSKLRNAFNQATATYAPVQH